MSFENEEKMMNGLKIKAKDGKVLVAKHICKIVELKVGKAVSDDYIWDLFKRHNWKKKMTRPEQPKKQSKSREV